MPYFILKKGAPVEVPDIHTWAHWFDSKSPDRIIEKTTTGEVEISTVFFGLDPSSHNDVPTLYRTLVNPPDETKAVYATLEEAIVGHEEICRQMEAALSNP